MAEETGNPWEGIFSQYTKRKGDAPAAPAAAAAPAAPAPPPAAPTGKARVLLADSETAYRNDTRKVLEDAGFEVELAFDGEEALGKIRLRPPDVAVLDLQLAGKGGLEVARRLRRNPLCASLPVIILARQADRRTKLEGLGLDVDDFVNKVGDLDELVGRLAMIVRRNRYILNSNALTHLPGNRVIEETVSRMLAEGRPTAVIYSDLNNFKAFNDAYGFDAGDEVIHATARLLAEFVQEEGGEGDFLGHIGGDDFIYVTTPDRAEQVCPRIVAGFEAFAPGFYSETDRKNGYIVSTDRFGQVRKFGFVGLALGVVHNRWRKLESFGKVAEIGAELKHHAKENERSSWVMDRRKE